MERIKGRLTSECSGFSCVAGDIKLSSLAPVAVSRGGGGVGASPTVAPDGFKRNPGILDYIYGYDFDND